MKVNAMSDSSWANQTYPHGLLPLELFAAVLAVEKIVLVYTSTSTRKRVGKDSSV